MIPAICGIVSAPTTSYVSRIGNWRMLILANLVRIFGMCQMPSQATWNKLKRTMDENRNFYNKVWAESSSKEKIKWYSLASSYDFLLNLMDSLEQEELANNVDVMEQFRR